MPNPLDLKRIRDYCAKATPEPWATHATLHLTPPECVDLVLDGSSRGVDAKHLADQGRLPMLPAGFISADDARFISNARTDLPAAVAEIEELRAEVARLKEDNNCLRIRYTQIQAQDL